MESQLKILLAGFGDIATRLTAQLVKKGIHPMAVKRSAMPAQLPVDLIRGDMTDADFVTRLFANAVDVVVVSMTPSEFTDEGYQKTYATVAKNLHKAISAASLKPKLVLWVSSSSVYGEGDGSWVDEQSLAQPQTFSSRRLLEAEKIIASLPVEHCIVRFSGIYGPGRNRMINKLRAGSIAASEPEVWSNRIHSDDCAGVLEHLIKRFSQCEELPPLVLATDCLPTPIHQVHKWLAKALGITIIDEQAPPARANRRCSNKALLATGYQFIYPNYQAGYQSLLKAI